MANRSITQLQVANTPLTGMEVVPIVQGGITKQTLLADVALLTQQDVQNDVTTSTPLYPLFANVTSGNLGPYLFTSDAQYLFTPSSGTLEAKIIQADNGLYINTNTITSSYTIASSNNALSAGPVTVAGGVIVTTSPGSTWTVV